MKQSSWLLNPSPVGVPLSTGPLFFFLPETKVYNRWMQNLLPLHQKIFLNTFTDSLPADPITENYVRTVSEACFSNVRPEPVTDPYLYGFSKELALDLNLSKPQKDDIEILAGNVLSPSMRPYAACYGGHQFGHWAGQLGDGRAISLGELRDSKNQIQELQLKGAGPTPYSRRGDGRAVLRSSVREFLMSEAMYHLGIPTTRALSLIHTGEDVLRDMFYDGNAMDEPGAIVCRVAPSFIRFGNFEILAHRNEVSTLKKLYSYTLKTHFPELGSPDSPKAVRAFFHEVSRRTARLIAHWMRVGFVHGVMNTDNLSILGLTIDYGPYGWLEGYDPMWTPNTTDASSLRYCYGRQPEIGLWNLSRLAMSLRPLGLSEEDAEGGLRLYQKIYRESFETMFAAKLGFSTPLGDQDLDLLHELFSILSATETDMTIFFRNLARIPLQNASEEQLLEILEPAYYTSPEAVKTSLLDWLGKYQERRIRQNLSPSESRLLMNQANPKYVLRNYLAQEAIDLAQSGDTSRIDELLNLLKKPYDEQPENERFFTRRPEWARYRPGCSALSCSS